MKRTRILKVVGLSIVTGSFITFLHTNGQSEPVNGLMLANVEALSSDGDASDDPFADCPRDKYIRNEKETWIPVTVKYEVGFGFYVTIKGQKVKLGIGGESIGTVFYPDCTNSTGNCCEKAHLNKEYRYA